MTIKDIYRPYKKMTVDGDTMRIVVKPLLFIHDPKNSIITEKILTGFTDPLELPIFLITNFCYVQIIENESDPESVGKILPYSLPKPAVEIIDGFTQRGHSSFDPFEGIEIELVYTAVNQPEYRKVFYKMDADFLGVTTFTYNGIKFNANKGANQIIKILKEHLSPDFINLHREVKADKLVEQERRKSYPSTPPELTKAILKVDLKELNRNDNDLLFQVIGDNVIIWYNKTEIIRLFEGRLHSETDASGKWFHEGQWQADVIEIVGEVLRELNDRRKERKEREKEILKNYGK